jgi:hypothetical protein
MFHSTKIISFFSVLVRTLFLWEKEYSTWFLDTILVFFALKALMMQMNSNAMIESLEI